MRLTGSRAYAKPAPAPTMPPGLVELMEGLTKDVLKNNPENIYEFCAGHMQKLLEIRDGPPPPKKQLSLEQKITKAQETIRQRIRDRQNQRNKNMLEHSSLSQEHEDIPPQNLDSNSTIEPVMHIKEFVLANEVEIFHDTDVALTSKDTSTDEASHKEDEVKKDMAQTQILEEKESTEKLQGEVIENIAIDDVKQVSEIVAVEEIQHEVNDVENAASDHVKQVSEIVAVEEIQHEVNEVENAASDDVKQVSEIVAVEEIQHEVNEVENAASDDVKQVSEIVAVEEIQHEVNDVENTASDDVQQASEIVAVEEIQHEVNDGKIIQNVETKKTSEQAKEVKENSFDNRKENSDVQSIAKENEITGDIVITHNLEIMDSVEKVNLDVKENITSDNEQQIHDEPIVETDKTVNVNQDPQCKDAVVDHTEIVPENKDNEKIQLVELEDMVTKIDNNVGEKAINDQCPLQKELIKNLSDDVTSIRPLTNNSETKLSLKNDNLTAQAKDVIEEDIIIKKQELTVAKHDDILIEQDDIHIESEEPVATTDSNHETKVKEYSETLLPISDNAGEEVSHNTSPHQTETPLDGSQVEPSSDTETPDIKPDLEVSVSGAKSEGQVISVKIIDKVNPKIDNDPKKEKHLDVRDVHINETNNISSNQIIETDDKFPEQERAYSGEFEVKQNNVIDDDATTVNKNGKIFENDTENTAVSGMDLETAAITIQKVFRTFLFSKSRASTLDDAVNENSLDEDIEKKDEPEYVLTSANLNKERRTLGISRMDTMLQTVNEEKSLSLSDDSSLSSAATTIQAHVRGFLVRNRLASNTTASSSSLVNSDGPSTVSLDGDVNEPIKTILNIHIVPERGQFMSRDESLLTSIDLPLDNSPLSSINLHPLGYDKSERRKQLKREDAVQSISPPSNNSGKLSEEVDSVKDTLNNSADLKQETENISGNGNDKDTSNIKLENKSISEDDLDKPLAGDTVKQENTSISVNGHDKTQDADTESCDTTLTISSTAETVVDAETYNAREVLSSPEHNFDADKGHEVVTNSSSDEMDVVTPFPTIPEKAVDIESDEKPKLVHSGEFHDLVVQTQVKRTESSVVREFKNVLVYFLLWDKT